MQTAVRLGHDGWVQRAGARGARGLDAGLVLFTAATWGALSGWRPAAAAGPATTAPKAYIGLYGDSAVGVLDTATGRMLREIKVPAGPEAVGVTPDGRRVYVTSEDATQLSVIDTATDTVIETRDLGAGPEGMALSPDTKTLLVAVFGDDRVDALDTATFDVVAHFPVAKPHGVAFAPDGRTAYVGSQDRPGRNAIVVLDLAGRRVAGRVPVDQTPRGLTVSPDGQSLYFTTANSDVVQLLDTATHAVTAQIPVGVIPHQIAFTPDHTRALAVVQGTGQLAVIDAATRRVIQRVAVGRFPHWVALTSDGTLAYVSNEGDNTLSVIDMAALRVVATLPVGREPRKIALQRGPGAMAAYEPGATAPAAAGFAAEPPRPAPAAAPGDAEIRMRDFDFGPGSVTVAAGHRVTWVNDDPVPHSATAQGGRWDTDQVVPGGSFTVTMTTPGTYAYSCNDHPFMRATIVVTP